MVVEVVVAIVEVAVAMVEVIVVMVVRIDKWKFKRERIE